MLVLLVNPQPAGGAWPQHTARGVLALGQPPLGDLEDGKGDFCRGFANPLTTCATGKGFGGFLGFPPVTFLERGASGRQA